MKKVEALLMARQSYLKKITDVTSSVVHNRATTKRLRYYKKAVSTLENQIREELDNESK